MFNNSINKKNPEGRPIPLPRRTTMTLIVGSGNKRQTFDRPLDKVEREMMAEQIKAAYFRPATLHPAVLTE